MQTRSTFQRFAIAASLAAVALLGAGCKSRRAVEIVAGKDNTCLRTNDGRVYCWGDDAYMQTKDPSFATKPGQRNAPKRVANIEGARAISLTASHGCAAKNGGGIDCFLDVDLEGTNVSGIDAKSLGEFKAGVCAATTAGEIKCFKSASAREIPRTPLDPPSGISDIRAVATGERHVCALENAGTVLCWGEAERGQLGQPDPKAPPTKGFVRVAGLKDITAIATGESFSCALGKDGQVWCWGFNELGQVGQPAGGDFGNMVNKPTPVPDVQGATAIAAGPWHTCAVVAGGAVSCWGSNMYGELGRARSKGAQPKAALVPGISHAVSVACGEQHSCALLDSGDIKCWGRNNRGQLGDGTNTDSATPVETKHF